MQLILKVEIQTAQTNFHKNFQNPELEWKDINTLPRHVTTNANLCIFQCKSLHNILYLNKMLYRFGKGVSPLFSFCMEEPQSPIHLFILVQKLTFS